MKKNTFVFKFELSIPAIYYYWRAFTHHKISFSDLDRLYTNFNFNLCINKLNRPSPAE